MTKGELKNKIYNNLKTELEQCAAEGLHLDSDTINTYYENRCKAYGLDVNNETENDDPVTDYSYVTEQGYLIVAKLLNSQEMHIVFKRDRDYGWANTYNIETGTWCWGHYDYQTEEDAYMSMLRFFALKGDVKEITKALPDAVLEEAFRSRQEEYVKEDVAGYLEDHGFKQDQEIIDSVARDYARYSDYDCNLTYWDNIGNLVESYEPEEIDEDEDE